MKEILDVIHNTIYQFFDVCGDDEEAPMSDKDKLLLEVNKAICNNLKALEQEPILDKIRAEIDKIYNREGNSFDCLNALDELKEFIDKYKAESEG
jgi:hypothetical protein